MLILTFVLYDKNIALKANAYLIAISPITFFIAAATARRDAFIRLNIVKIFYLLLSFLMHSGLLSFWDLILNLLEHIMGLWLTAW